MNTVPPRRLPTVLILAAALLVAGIPAVSCSGESARVSTSAEASIYYCPMHPTVTSDKPGDCPICHMRLVKLERPAPGETGVTGAPAAPGDAPRREERAAEEGVPAGWSEIDVPAERVQESGISFGTVAVKRMRRTLRTSGRVAVDETRLQHVHTKVPGWIEHLAPLAPGDPVRRGDPLFELYAPDLLASQEEYLQTVRAERALGAGSDPDLVRAAGELRDAARRRLALWDIGPDAVARLEATGTAERTVTVRSPASGIVAAKSAAHGMYADPAMDLFTIADLSRVWVIADVYENELALVRAGASAEVRLAYAPGPARRGRVALVSPALDPATRTAKVRIELDNSGGALRPETFADVLIATDAGDRTVVPKSAVVQSGERSIVFVDRGGGRLAPREIRTGIRFDDDLEVLSGLTPGERIVTSAAFVVDSESRLRASVGAAHGAPASDADPAAPRGSQAGSGTAGTTAPSGAPR